MAQNNAQNVLESRTENEILNNLKSDTTLQNYIDGNNFNLSSSVSNGVSNHDNPIIERLSEQIRTEYLSEANIATNDIKSMMENYIYADDSPITNPARVNMNEVNNVMDEVRSELNNLTNNITPINNPSSNNNNQNDEVL